MNVYSFEKLDVWKHARELVVWVYKITAKFPSEEKFGLTMQLRRSAVSVVSNIAEGSARTSAKDQAYFTQLAYSSLIEILNQLLISNDLQFLSDQELAEGRSKVEDLTFKIAALRKAQMARINSKPKTLNPKP